MENPLYQSKRSWNLEGNLLSPKDNPFYGFAMMIMGWFSISAETFLRRDFGERYYSKGNFMIGLLFMAVFYLLGSVMGDWTGRAASFFRAAESGSDSLFGWIIAAYVFLGLLHRLKIWGRAESGTRRHSIYDGDSWLLYIAPLFTVVINFLLKVGLRLLQVMQILRFTLTQEQREAVLKANPIDNNVEFTQRVIEPITLLILAGLALLSGFGITGSWLLWSALSVAFYSALRHDAAYQQDMDRFDMALEAQCLAPAVLGKSDRIRVSPRQRKQWEAEAKEIAQRRDREEAQQMKKMQPTMAKVYAAMDPVVAAMMADDTNGHSTTPTIDAEIDPDDTPPTTTPEPPKAA